MTGQDVEVLLGHNHRTPVVGVRIGDKWVCSDNIRRSAPEALEGWVRMVPATDVEEAASAARVACSRQAHALNEVHEKRHRRDLEEQRERLVARIGAAAEQHAAAVRLARAVRAAGRKTVPLAELLAALGLEGS